MEKIGITTTVPVEIIFASGNIPVDLNNIFITDENPIKYIEKAEHDGYPRSVCSWIKGLYSVVLANEDIKKVIGVTEGDCSNTHALMETLKFQGIELINFSYPFDRKKQKIKAEIENLMDYFDVSYEEVYKVKKELRRIRKKLCELDELTYKTNQATGFENHIFQVSSSDFNGDYIKFEKELDEKLIEVKKRKPDLRRPRLAYIGVPPIFTDIYEYIDEVGAKVVFNEVQRQFAMPYLTEDIVEQYHNYTYPYDIFFRLEDINKEIEKRSIDGVIHYTQSFCYRQIEDIIVRKLINRPLITIEGEVPGKIDARTKLRLETFIDML